MVSSSIASSPETSKNAFNSAGWLKILEALQNFKVPKYLFKLLVSYFFDTTILYGTQTAIIQHKVSARGPQETAKGGAEKYKPK